MGRVARAHVIRGFGDTVGRGAGFEVSPGGAAESFVRAKAFEARTGELCGHAREEKPARGILRRFGELQNSRERQLSRGDRHAVLDRWGGGRRVGCRDRFSRSTRLQLAAQNRAVRPARNAAILSAIEQCSAGESQAHHHRNAGTQGIRFYGRSGGTWRLAEMGSCASMQLLRNAVLSAPISFFVLASLRQAVRFTCFAAASLATGAVLDAVAAGVAVAAAAAGGTA